MAAANRASVALVAALLVASVIPGVPAAAAATLTTGPFGAKASDPTGPSFGAFREPPGARRVLAINVTYSVVEVLGQEHAFLNSIQVTYDVGGAHPLVDGPHGNPAFPRALSRTLRLAPGEAVTGGAVSTDACTLSSPLGTVELLELTTSKGSAMAWGFASPEGAVRPLRPEAQQQRGGRGGGGAGRAARRALVAGGRAAAVGGARGGGRGGMRGREAEEHQRVHHHHEQQQQYELVGIRGMASQGHFGAVHQLSFVWAPRA